MDDFYLIKIKIISLIYDLTRKHSSKMRTIHCSDHLSCHECPLLPCTPPPCMPATTHTPCHAHPLSCTPPAIRPHHACPCHAHPHYACPPATHAPCHACPLPHTHPLATHAPPAMHVHPLQCMPSAMHTPCHTCPLATHVPLPCMPPTTHALPVNRMTDRQVWKHYLSATSFADGN